MEAPSKLRVGELLIQEGAITGENLKKALAVQKEKKSTNQSGRSVST